MKNFKKYLWFCRKFHNVKLPKLKFKELNAKHRQLYKTKYKIDENDVNKATFFVFLIISLSFILISLLLMPFNLIFVVFCSLLFSLLISYRFNLTLCKALNKIELGIDALLVFLKIDYSIIQKSHGINADCCLKFIELIKSYEFPLSKEFEKILKRVHEGAVPEKELFKLNTPSDEFNNYVRNLLVNKFNYNYDYNELSRSVSEKKFKIYLRTIETKISIIFFIGLFLPIGMCFLILFQQIDTFVIILCVPIFLLILYMLFRKLIVIDVLLIGLLKENSNIEKKKFDEFLLFLNSFAIYLRGKISPEKAFLLSYLHNNRLISELKIEVGISKMLNLTSSFNEVLNGLKLDLKTVRYNLILETIKNLIKENALGASDKIFDILTVVNKHRDLEKKLETIINGEKFKVFIFIFLLSLIIGAIGGMIPFFAIIIKDINYVQTALNNTQINAINIYETITVFITLLLTNSISSYYFLKIIKSGNKYLIIMLANLCYTAIFYISFFNLLTFF